MFSTNFWEIFLDIYYIQQPWIVASASNLSIFLEGCFMDFFFKRYFSLLSQYSKSCPCPNIFPGKYLLGKWDFGPWKRSWKTKEQGIKNPSAVSQYGRRRKQDVLKNFILDYIWFLSDYDLHEVSIILFEK